METERDPFGNPYVIDGQRPFCGCALAFAMVLCAVLLTLFSCRSTRTVVLPEHHHHIALQHDTLHTVDSVIRESHTVIREADHAQLQELGIQLRENERAILVLRKQLERQTSQKEQHTTDTLILHDSIPVPVPVPAAPQRIPLRQRIADRMADTAAAFFAILLLLAIIRRALRKHD